MREREREGERERDESKRKERERERDRESKHFCPLEQTGGENCASVCWRGVCEGRLFHIRDAYGRKEVCGGGRMGGCMYALMDS